MFFKDRIIKRLILKEWFRFFGGSFFLLFLLISVGNLLTGFLRGNVTPYEVIMNHLLETPGAMNRILPISCLVASLFSINKLRNRNELTAIFASGFSRQDFFVTVFQAALAVSVFQFMMGGFLDPYARKHRSQLIKNPESKFKNLQSKGLRASTIGSGKLWYRSQDYFFSFATYDKKLQKLYDVNLYFIDPSSHLQKKVEANSMTYIDGNEWKITRGNQVTSLSNKDFPSFKTIYNEILPIREKPSDFLQIEADITTLNILGLYNYISQLNRSGININEYLVMFYDKFSSALICIIFALVASIAIYSPNRRGSTSGRNIVKVLIFTLAYWLVYSYAIELGKNSKIPAMVSTFTVPFLFTLFLVYNFVNNRELR